MEIYRAIPCKYFCIFSKLLTSVYFASISYNSLPVFSMQFLLYCQYIWFYSIWRFALVRVSLWNNLQFSATDSCVNYSNETSTQNKFKGLFCACCLQIFIYIFALPVVDAMWASVLLIHGLLLHYVVWQPFYGIYDRWTSCITTVKV